MASPVHAFTSQEQRELERYYRYLYLRTAQIVVQSRQGELQRTKCEANPNTPSWFSLALQEEPEIVSESRRTTQLAEETDQSLLNLTLGVEISLQTAEGDCMSLETWKLFLKQNSNCERVMSNRSGLKGVYNQMSLLLKSLLCATRSLPAYKLSRKQGAETFVLCYRFFYGEESKPQLGSSPKTCQVGQVKTPLGPICLRVDYRTQMTLSDSLSSRGGYNTSENEQCSKTETNQMWLKEQSSPRRNQEEEEETGQQDSGQQGTSKIASPSSNPSQRTKLSSEDLECDRDLRVGAFARHRHCRTNVNDESHEEASLALFDMDNSNSSRSREDTNSNINNSISVRRRSSNIKTSSEDSLHNLEASPGPAVRVKSQDLSSPFMRLPSITKDDPKPSPKKEKDTSPRIEDTAVAAAAATSSSRASLDHEFELLDFKLPAFARAFRGSQNELAVFFGGSTAQQGATTTAESEKEPSKVESDEMLMARSECVADQLNSYEASLNEYEDMLKALETSGSESENAPN